MSEENPLILDNSEFFINYTHSLENLLGDAGDDISRHFRGPNREEGSCLKRSMRELIFLIGEYSGDSYEGLYQQVISFQNPTDSVGASALIKEGIKRANQVQTYVAQCIQSKELPKLDKIKEIIHPHLK